MSQTGDDFDPFGGTPQRAAAKVVPLHIPPATAEAEPGEAPPGSTPQRIAQHFAPQMAPQLSVAQQLCADLVGKLNLADPPRALQQMGFGEWQATFQTALAQAIGAGGTAAADFYVCVLQSLKAHGIDPQQASAILAPLSRQVTGADQAPPPGGPLESPPLPPQQPPPQQPPAAVPPGIIPSQPLPPGAAPGAPAGPELAPSPGGIILAPSAEQKSSKALWGVVALVVLGGGAVAWYYAQQR